MFSSTPSNHEASSGKGWRASLRLRFAERDERTYLRERQHSGPLLVQRPFYPEANVCHAYIVHPPGGVVGGDELSMQVSVGERASTLLTTPAAGKFYRSEGASAHLSQVFTLEKQASVEWLPQDTIYYRGARVRAETRLELKSSSRCIAWEVACLGLPARGEVFDEGQLRLSFALSVEGKLRWLDRLRIDGESPSRFTQWGLAGYTAIGTMLAFPANKSMLEELRALDEPQVELAFTVVDEVLVCRALSAQAEPARRALVQCWRQLRPTILSRTAVLPRIWAT